MHRISESEYSTGPIRVWDPTVPARGWRGRVARLFGSRERATSTECVVQGVQVVR
jgi:hypothetical protein